GGGRRLDGVKSQPAAQHVTQIKPLKTIVVEIVKAESKGPGPQIEVIPYAAVDGAGRGQAHAVGCALGEQRGHKHAGLVPGSGAGGGGAEGEGKSVGIAARKTQPAVDIPTPVAGVLRGMLLGFGAQRL